MISLSQTFPSLPFFFPPSFLQIFIECRLRARLWAKVDRIHHQDFFFFFFPLGLCDELNVCAQAPKSVCRNLIPKTMVSGDGVFEKWLGHDDWVSALTKEMEESSLALSTLWGHSKKKALYEPGSRLSKTSNLSAPWSRTSQPPEVWERNVSCLFYFI